MKKLFKALVCCLLAVAVCANFAACSLFGGSSSDTTYTIQYTDDSGIHTIEVKYGDLYTLESVPERTGYTFLGLFDAETGGTQYVNSSGSCVSAFTYNANIVLYPQYKANEYTLVLDYGEAAVTGSRQYTVTYGESLPDLPSDLTVSHKAFSGWYTQANCGGTKVADSYGNIPVVSVVNEDNFDITNSTTYIYLYAGFTAETYTVTFNFGSDISSKTVEAEYGAEIADIAPSTRNSEGYAVLAWSLSASGSEYTGTVTGDMALYAIEWAPCIDFNSNGGYSVTSIIAKEGSTITLPSATKDLYKFMYWSYSDGSQCTLTTMPSASTTLTAVWQAMIVFDENGGSSVEDISEASGTTITLPTPEKDGYIFAGWYTSDKTQYTTTKMPSEGIELKAGWYAEKSGTKIVYSQTDSQEISTYWTPKTVTTEISLADFDSGIDFNGTNIYVEVGIYMQTKHNECDLICSVTSSSTVSSSTTYSQITFTDNGVTSYRKQEYQTSMTIENGIFYIILDATSTAGIRSVTVSDYYVSVIYPDTTTLYL